MLLAYASLHRAMRLDMANLYYFTGHMTSCHDTSCTSYMYMYRRHETGSSHLLLLVCVHLLPVSAA